MENPVNSIRPFSTVVNDMLGQSLGIHAPVKIALLISIFSESVLFDGDPCHGTLGGLISLLYIIWR